MPTFVSKSYCVLQKRKNYCPRINLIHHNFTLHLYAVKCMQSVIFLCVHSLSPFLLFSLDCKCKIAMMSVLHSMNKCMYMSSFRSLSLLNECVHCVQGGALMIVIRKEFNVLLSVLFALHVPVWNGEKNLLFILCYLLHILRSTDK